MQPMDMADVFLRYAMVFSIMTPVYILSSRDKLSIAEHILPTGSILFLCFLFVLFCPNECANAPLVAHGFVIFICALLWLVSFYMMSSGRFGWFSGYQVVCLFIYFILVEMFGYDHINKIIFYTGIIFSFGLFVLVRVRAAGSSSGAE
ncbi:MAG: hypothetical protein AB1717_02715 [Pseudomonadota bacterium]